MCMLSVAAHFFEPGWHCLVRNFCIVSSINDVWKRMDASRTKRSFILVLRNRKRRSYLGDVLDKGRQSFDLNNPLARSRVSQRRHVISVALIFQSSSKSCSEASSLAPCEVEAMPQSAML
jgi:hypothetical protein